MSYLMSALCKVLLPNSLSPNFVYAREMHMPSNISNCRWKHHLYCNFELLRNKYCFFLCIQGKNIIIFYLVSVPLLIVPRVISFCLCVIRLSDVIPQCNLKMLYRDQKGKPYHSHKPFGGANKNVLESRVWPEGH